MKAAAVIVAAGKGLRMGGSIPKQYLPIREKPLLYYTLKAFDESLIDEVVIVTGSGDVNYVRETIVDAFGIRKVSSIVEGGKERYDSCFAGIRTLMEREEAGLKPDVILIHDGARALIRPDLVNATLTSLIDHRAVCPGVVPKDSMRIVGPEAGGATRVLDRSALRIVQTPQGFEAGLIYEAYLTYYKDVEAGRGQAAITDDTMVAERYGGADIYIIEGSYENIKITTAEDMLLAERVLAEREEDR